MASPSVKTETTRKCGNCGDVGHMSKLLSQVQPYHNADLSQKPIANAPSGPSSSRPISKLPRKRLLSFITSRLELTLVLLAPTSSNRPRRLPLYLLDLPLCHSRQRLLDVQAWHLQVPWVHHLFQEALPLPHHLLLLAVPFIQQPKRMEVHRLMDK